MKIVSAEVFASGLSSAHERITAYIKQCIVSEKMPPGYRLPSTSELANSLGVSVFTVHTALTPLVRSGLVVRKRRMGTFVTEKKTILDSAALYYGHDFWGGREMDFYRSVHRELLRELKANGMATKIFIDSRALPEQEAIVTPELSQAVNQREVQCVICPLIPNSAAARLVQKLPVPSTFLADNRRLRHSIFWDFLSFFKLGFDSMKRRGARDVAIISTALPEMTPPLSQLVEMATDRGLRLRPTMFRTPGVRLDPAKCEAYGHEQFLSIWSGRERPDGLLVYADTAVRGVLLALALERVEVPQKLKLAFHRNDDVNIYCPYHATWITSRVRDLVHFMVQNVRAQFHGESFAGSSTLPYYATTSSLRT